jgi:MarR family transcriptional regulator, organic hydroperoxide resistance regulator
MASQAPTDQIPAFEQHLQAFLARRGTDIDAQAAVFNLDHGALEVISTLEGLALRPQDLTHAGFVLLFTLWVTGPRETRELAAVLRVTKGAVVGAVNTLERRGLARRVRSDVDRRLVTYELTDEGASLIARVQKQWRELEVEVTSSLTIAEKRTLSALCRKMAEAAQELRRKRGARSPELPDPAVFLPEPTKLPNKLRSDQRRKPHVAAPH